MSPGTEDKSGQAVKAQKLAYDAKYKMKVGIGLCNGEREEFTNPATHSSYSEEEWNALTRQEQEEWLQEETREWALSLVEYSWEEPKAINGQT